ncbi:hypothetical protein FVEG_06764 [Fusarium verticillioides 7600]|uniref:Uncharacterized protein n=1 Tax=Gibberella moniliformis (strain M3125 / FGSC 7600) TaxID=334819 RepID=W7MF55_GIBM7|nr:hypothetical protein FVEG_06764 [Fusarium verticillioides 7600]EWG46205.1 hypothetical protein FVEG_06764 [Fusarium verticillioides 7600]
MTLPRCIIILDRRPISHRLHDEAPRPVLLYIDTSPQLSSTENNSLGCLLSSQNYPVSTTILFGSPCSRDTTFKIRHFYENIILYKFE